MTPLKLVDGTELKPLPIEQKTMLEKEMGDLLEKYNAVIVPALAKDLSSISATINIYEKLIKSPLYGGDKDTTEETTKTD